MTPAATPIGEMMDFLKTYPAFTMHDYVWGLSAPMIKIMLLDATQVLPLTTEKQKKEYKLWKRNSKCNNGETDDPNAFAAALGIPTFD